MSQEIENDQSGENPEQQEGQPDAIELLAERLGMIESALGVGNSQPGDSNLLGRLSAIEQAIAKPQRERSLPESITWQQAGSLAFMRKNGILLEDLASGKVKVVRD